MKVNTSRQEKLQDAVQETIRFGLSISPKRLSILLSNCKAERLPICITGSPCHLLVAIDIEYFEGGVMNVNDKEEGETTC